MKRNNIIKPVALITLCLTLCALTLPVFADTASNVSVSAPVKQVNTTSAHLIYVSDIKFGMVSADVKVIQTVLATMPAIYRAGLVTSYFGPLTEQAVKNFQTKYALPSTGIVDSATLAKINDLIDLIKIPIISAVSAKNTKGNSTTLSWTTDKPATTQVFYSTGVPLFSGAGSTFFVKSSDLSLLHEVEIDHLATSTLYNYLVVSVNATSDATSSSAITFTTSN